MPELGLPSIYSSTHPAIQALFASEFAAHQQQQKHLEAAAALENQKEQIRAQAALAQSQLAANQQAQQQANMFKAQELQQRADQAAMNNRLFGRQLDIDEKYKNALSGSTREDILKQNRKQSIIDAQSAAKVGAQSLQDIYEANLADAIELAKKNRGFFTFESTAIDKLKPGSTDPMRIAAENAAWQKTLALKQNDRTGQYQHVIPDHSTHQFVPVQFDESGNVVMPQQQSGPPASLAPNPAALGNGAGGLQSAPAPSAAAPNTSGVQRPYGDNMVELGPHEDAALQEYLGQVPEAQRPAAYSQMVDGWIQTGRARVLGPAPATMFDVQKDMPWYGY